MFSSLFSWYFSRNALPYWCLLVLDCIIIIASGFLSTYFLLGGSGVINNFWPQLILWVCVMPFFMIGMRIFHTYSGIVRYSSFVDLMRVACALLIGTVLTGATMFFLPAIVMGVKFRLRVLAITFIIAMIGQWSVRILAKYIFDTSVKDQATKRVYIYGVREGGVSLAKSIRNQHPLRYLVKGFMCDDSSMIGRFLLGVHVHDSSAATIEQMKRQGVSALFVSPLCNEQFRNNTELVNALIKANITIMMMPSAEVWDGKTDLNHAQLHEVDIEDLLPRDKIEVNLEAIGRLLKGRRILITGAAGSIGSEMVRQVAKFSPAELILIDQAETPMHDIRLYMHNNHPELSCQTIVGSITNASHMEQIFSQYRPEYVFHAAAYKHVPMMEDNPAMAVQNNIYGTRVIADLAVKYGTLKFVMISTDKAVNPTNVMGCSKRICEIYCQSLNAALQRGSIAAEQQGVQVVQDVQIVQEIQQGSIITNGEALNPLNGEALNPLNRSTAALNTITDGNIRKPNNLSESEGTLQTSLSDNKTGGVQVRQSLCSTDQSCSGISDGQHCGGLRETRQQGVHELPLHSEGVMRRGEESSDAGSRCGLHHGRDISQDVCGVQEPLNCNSQLYQESEGLGIQGHQISINAAEQQGVQVVQGVQEVQQGSIITNGEALNPLNPLNREALNPLNPLNREALNPLNGEALTRPSGVTQFITTRFGNVLGSNGSVIPIFKDQIRRGGPVTVTHPDIIRYFMLIPEACQLVLEAGTMGHGGEIFVFDMGKPVRIADLAQRMIDLSGAHNVQIKYTGLRDGEKLYEEVLNDAELTKPTVHPKIKVASVREYPYEQALQNEEDLYRLSLSFDDMSIVRKMKEIVPEYKSQHSKYQVLD